MRHKLTIAISIPTGIGAQIGGYAGDGGKIARMFSKDFNVIVHPNVINGGILSAINEDMLYLEGYHFDEFLKGKISLNPLEYGKTNKIGVIFDKSIPQDILNVHLNTISAMIEVKGLCIPYYEITEEEVGVEFYIKEGFSTGRIKCEQTLLKAAKKLISKGVEAIAVVCYFNDDEINEDYENGTGIDPIGGVEAIISHYLAKELMIPTAHSPAFNSIDILKTISNPKVAAENISSTYLPCILEGLSIAPKIDKKGISGIKNKDLTALILPYNALGSIAPIAARENGIQILTVKNETKTSFGCNELRTSDIMVFRSYQNCLEYLKRN